MFRNFQDSMYLNCTEGSVTPQEGRFEMSGGASPSSDDTLDVNRNNTASSVDSPSSTATNTIDDNIYDTAISGDSSNSNPTGSKSPDSGSKFYTSMILNVINQIAKSDDITINSVIENLSRNTDTNTEVNTEDSNKPDRIATI